MREKGHGVERGYDGGDEGQRSVEDKNSGSRPQDSLGWSWIKKKKKKKKSLTETKFTNGAKELGSEEINPFLMT